MPNKGQLLNSAALKGDLIMDIILSVIASFILSFWLPRFSVVAVGLIPAAVAVFVSHNLLKAVYLAQGGASIWSIILTGVLLGAGIGYGVKSCIVLMMGQIDDSSSVDLVAEQTCDGEHDTTSNPLRDE